MVQYRRYPARRKPYRSARTYQKRGYRSYRKSNRMSYASTRSARTSRNTVQNTLRGFLGAAGDAKYIDIPYANYNMSAGGGTIAFIDQIAQGTTVNQRDGKAWLETSLQIRGSAVADSATTTATGCAYIVWDRQPNKIVTPPLVTEILEQDTSNSFPKRENTSRFKILKKMAWAFSGNTTAAAGNQTSATTYYVDEYVVFPKDAVCTTTTNDTTGALGNRINGALYLLTTGNTAAGTADAVLSVTMRLNFKDI